jgi:hypothetical protein
MIRATTTTMETEVVTAITTVSDEAGSGEPPAFASSKEPDDEEEDDEEEIEAAELDEEGTKGSEWGIPTKRKRPAELWIGHWKRAGSEN